MSTYGTPRVGWTVTRICHDTIIVWASDEEEAIELACAADSCDFEQASTEWEAVEVEV
jgi:hypothetical protein